MADVSAIVSRKGSQVLTVRPDTSVLDAAVLMNQHRIGALIVVDHRDHVVGIFTERDVLRRVVSERRDPADTRVEAVMTRDLVTCTPATTIGKARAIFMDRRIRHLPVLSAPDQLRGMISIGDLNAWELSGQECKIAALEEYLYGMA
ncbi:MAG: CBS domain-containing protein [Planctomycetota bacterium]